MKCNFYALQFINTGLDKLKFFRKSFSREYFQQNFSLSAKTAEDWRSFSFEVCEAWLDGQEPIGGPDEVFGVDESKFGKLKHNRGCIVDACVGV